MKLLLMTLMLSFLTLAASAQIPEEVTRIRDNMVRWYVPTIVAPGTAGVDYVVVILPDGTQVLRILPPGQMPQPVMIWKTVVIRVVDPVPLSFTVPDANFDPGSLFVARALVLSPGVDYILSGQTVTFVGRQQPVAGDVVQLKYQIPK